LFPKKKTKSPARCRIVGLHNTAHTTNSKHVRKKIRNSNSETYMLRVVSCDRIERYYKARGFHPHKRRWINKNHFLKKILNKITV
jgi:hypothetical protein